MSSSSPTPSALWVRRGQPGARHLSKALQPAGEEPGPESGSPDVPLWSPSCLTALPLPWEVMSVGSECGETASGLTDWVNLQSYIGSELPRNNGMAWKQTETTRILTQTENYLGLLMPQHNDQLPSPLLSFSSIWNAASQTAFPILKEWPCKRPKQMGQSTALNGPEHFTLSVQSHWHLSSLSLDNTSTGRCPLALSLFWKAPRSYSASMLGMNHWVSELLPAYHKRSLCWGQPRTLILTRSTKAIA